MAEQASINVEGFVQGVFNESFAAFKKDLVLYILAGLIVVFVGGFSLGILMGPLVVGFVQLARRRRRGEAATVSQIFDGMSSFGAAFLLTLIIAIGCFIGSMLLFVPALIVGLIVMFSFQVMVYKDAGVGDALKGSFELVKAHFVPSLVLFILLFVLNAIAGAIFIGAAVTVPFSLVATTIAYEKLTGQI